MKKNLFVCAVAMVAMCAVSCNKTSDTNPDVVSGRSARVSISLTGANVGSDTKALPVEGDEVLVNTVDAFVFNATGDIDSYGHYAASDFTTTAGTTKLNDGKELECTTGAGKIVYIVINGNDTNLSSGEVAFANIKNEAELKARIFKLEDNKIAAGTPPSDQLKNFQMIGKTANQTFKAGDNDVDVEVQRSVARVVIKKITKHFASEGLAPNDLIVKNIYMENVVGRYGFGNIVDGDYKFDGTSIAAACPAANWHNKYVPAIVDPATPATVDIEASYNLWLNRSLAAGVTFGANTTAVDGGVSKTSEIESTFYVMPNDVAWGYDDDADPATPVVFGPVGGATWGARHTKLVVETEYAGKTYYYSIPIAKNDVYPMGDDADAGAGYAGIKANTSYEIDELVLTRLGSTNPDEPTVAAMVNFNITVKPWVIQKLETESGKYVI